jgi:hypothetical protein
MLGIGCVRSFRTTLHRPLTPNDHISLARGRAGRPRLKSSPRSIRIVVTSVLGGGARHDARRGRIRCTRQSATRPARRLRSQNQPRGIVVRDGGSHAAVTDGTVATAGRGRPAFTAPCVTRQTAGKAPLATICRSRAAAEAWERRRISFAADASHVGWLALGSVQAVSQPGYKVPICEDPFTVTARLL